jgi:type III pantothenate kinase
MILAVDIGNSNIVIGGIDGDEILFEARLRTDVTKTSDEYCIDLKMILDVYGVESEIVEGSRGKYVHAFDSEMDSMISSDIGL